MRLRLHVRHGKVKAQRHLVPSAGGCAVNLCPVILGDLPGGSEILHRVPGCTLAGFARRPELRGDIGVVVLQPRWGISMKHYLQEFYKAPEEQEVTLLGLQIKYLTNQKPGSSTYQK